MENSSPMNFSHQKSCFCLPHGSHLPEGGLPQAPRSHGGRRLRRSAPLDTGATQEDPPAPPPAPPPRPSSLRLSAASRPALRRRGAAPSLPAPRPSRCRSAERTPSPNQAASATVSSLYLYPTRYMSVGVMLHATGGICNVG